MTSVQTNHNKQYLTKKAGVSRTLPVQYCFPNGFPVFGSTTCSVAKSICFVCFHDFSSILQEFDISVCQLQYLFDFFFQPEIILLNMHCDRTVAMLSAGQKRSINKALSGLLPGGLDHQEPCHSVRSAPLVAFRWVDCFGSVHVIALLYCLKIAQEPLQASFNTCGRKRTQMKMAVGCVLICCLHLLGVISRQKPHDVRDGESVKWER